MAIVFEIITHGHIYLHVQSVISPSKHGFLSVKSTVTNLAGFTHFLVTQLDNKGQVDVIYTDFLKPCDSVNHDISPSKLLTYKFTNELSQFFSSYVCNCKVRKH